jgi:Na+-driven multidrug efflux pump
MKAARQLLLIGWLTLTATVLLAFLFPKPISAVLRRIAPLHQLVPAFLLLATAAYFVSGIYFAGMNRKQ